MSTEKPVPCEVCSGSGIARGSKTARAPFNCPICDGSGRVRHVQGFFTLEKACTPCKGTGKVVSTLCPACAGSGRKNADLFAETIEQLIKPRGEDARVDLQINLEDAFTGTIADIASGGRSLKIDVPRGIADGTRIRLAGEGGQGTPRGDLFVHVRVREHPDFTRNGNDLHTRATVPLDTAIYGRTFELTQLDGKTLSVKAPDGVQSGTVLRLRGRGMPIVRSEERGDLHVAVFVQTPRVRARKSEPVIVVSYRRSDTKHIVGRIVDRLKAHFGKTSVFLDFDSMPVGQDFRHHLEATVREADVVLAVVGPDWMGRQAEEQPRIFDETDWVRVEIEMALRHSIPVVPVLIDATAMPKPEHLPASLRDFAFRHAADLDTGRDFDVHVDRLMKSVSQLLGRPSPDGQQPARDNDAADRGKSGSGWRFWK